MKPEMHYSLIRGKKLTKIHPGAVGRMRTFRDDKRKCPRDIFVELVFPFHKEGLILSLGVFINSFNVRVITYLARVSMADPKRNSTAMKYTSL